MPYSLFADAEILALDKMVRAAQAQARLSSGCFDLSAEAQRRSSRETARAGFELRC
jgi:hypothetical protein